MVTNGLLDNHPLDVRRSLTSSLGVSPYDPELWLQRGICHDDLRYPELAIGDVYRALLLVDELREAEFGSEFGSRGLTAWRARRKAGSIAAKACADTFTELQNGRANSK